MTRAQVTAIMNLMERNDNYCQGAPQQMANGLYRVMDVLLLIARELDGQKNFAGKIGSVELTWNSNESYCQSAPQQSANGVYRVVELLKVLIDILDKEKKVGYKARSVITTMELNESYCQSAPQQIAIGHSGRHEPLEFHVPGCPPAVCQRF